MKKYLFSILIILLLVPFANADFGVASQYYENNPILANPGETIDTYFKIQNTIGDTQDITVEILLLEGSEIVTLVDGTIYEVPADEQVTVNLKIEIPNDATPTTKYPIEALFKPLSSNVEEGTLQFIINIDREFEVIVLGSPPSEEEIPEEIPETKETDKKTGGKLWITFIFLISTIMLVIVAIIIKITIKNKRQNSYNNY